MTTLRDLLFELAFDVLDNDKKEEVEQEDLADIIEGYIVTINKRIVG